jgi:hypothetical protein
MAYFRDSFAYVGCGWRKRWSMVRRRLLASQDFAQEVPLWHTCDYSITTVFVLLSFEGVYKNVYKYALKPIDVII